MTHTFRTKLCIAVVAGVLLMPLTTQAATAGLDIKVSKKPVALLKGKVASVSDLLKEIVANDKLWYATGSNTIAPGLAYDGEVKYTGDNAYEADASTIQLTNKSVVRAVLGPRYPALSAAQCAAVRTSKDYPLLYGVIRDIVGRVNKDMAIQKKYYQDIQAATTKPMYDPPPLQFTSVGSSSVAAAFGSAVIEQRARKVAHANTISELARNHLYYTAKKTSVPLKFTQRVGGKVPASQTYVTKAASAVSFSVPAGNPCPPEPKL